MQTSNRVTRSSAPSSNEEKIDNIGLPNTSINDDGLI